VADERTDGGGATEEAHEPRECMPCRGSGKVISNLGGSPSTVTCPWCEGGGVRISGVDAQARWTAHGGGDGEATAAPDAAAGDAA
jgi:DnaJ-class molecular chaperone